MLLYKLLGIIMSIQGMNNTWVEASTSTIDPTTSTTDPTTDTTDPTTNTTDPTTRSTDLTTSTTDQTTTSTDQTTAVTFTTTTSYDPCLSSPCVNNGFCEKIGAYSVQCHCQPQSTDGIYVTHNYGYYCQNVYTRVIDNLVDNATPLFGPIAGGTNITLTGQYFSQLPPSTAYIGYYGNEINVSYASGNTAYFFSPSTNESDIDMLMPITVVFNATITRNTPFNYTYRGNPKIGDIYPLDHIISGGTSLTVSGTNMDAVANPILEITQEYIFTVTVGQTQEKKTNSTFYTSLCHPYSSSALNCPMPKLDIPDEFLPSRDHSAIPPSSGESSLDFIVGFQLDGYDRYQDVTDELPDKELSFYAAPSFVTLKEVLGFEPHEARPIYISGKGFLTGARMKDYSVRLGISNCTIVNVLDNQISFHPNATRPEYHEKDAERCGIDLYAIIVSVGYLEHKVGCLRYDMRQTFELVYIYLIICGGALLACVIFTVCICCLKRKKENIGKQPE